MKEVAITLYGDAIRDARRRLRVKSRVISHPELLQDSIAKSKGKEVGCVDEKFNYEDQSLKKSMQALPHSKIAALFSIFILPGWM